MDYNKEKEMLKMASRNLFVRVHDHWKELELKNIISQFGRISTQLKEPPENGISHTKDLETKVAANVNELSRLEAEGRDLALRHKELLQDMNNCQHECEQLEAEIQTVSTDVNARSQKMAEKLKFSSEEVKSHQEAAALYAERMGYRMKKIESGASSHIQFQFTNIDSRDPERMCLISLKVKEDQVYVTDCQPLVHGLGKLLRKLNETNDWHSFFVILRQYFVNNFEETS